MRWEGTHLPHHRRAPPKGSGSRAAWGSSRAPRAPSLSSPVRCSGSCHGSASRPPPPSPALCDYNGLCAGPRSAPLPAPPACAHAHACAHAARGLPLYIMQPPYRLRRHRAGGAPAASYLPLLDAVRKAWQSLG